MHLVDDTLHDTWIPSGGEPIVFELKAAAVTMEEEMLRGAAPA